jgi:hypothetical protein
VTRGEHDIAAAATIRECRAALAARGSDIVGEAVGREAAEIADWRHYPDGEAYDPVTHVQYFYHRHPAANSGCGREAIGDGGHLHVFLRGDGIPAGISPMLFADNAVAREAKPPQSAPLRRGQCEEVCHLVAIAVDRGGQPTGLFTTNRWVTGETWYRADDMARLLDRVRFDRARPTSLLDLWIEAVVCLFATEIAELLAERDKAILRWRWRRPRSNAFEDPRLEVTSIRAIDLEARLAAIEARALPPLAMPQWRGVATALASDGWGR